jgi:asparagine synthase (glutamine-hydrolysing)
MARKHVTVALGGDGGDELCGGYHTYQAQRLARGLDWMPAPARAGLFRAASLVPLSSEKRGFANSLRRFFQGLQRDPTLEHLRWMLFLDPGERRRLYTAEFTEVVGDRLEERLTGFLRPRQRDRLHGQTVADIRMYLAENILPKVDLMSMAVSLEARVPFLDNDVLDLALRIPGSLKRRHGHGKWILREAFRDLLPHAVLERSKEGFSIPLKNWLRKEWNPKMHELLEDGSLYREGRFRHSAVQRLMSEHEAGSHNHSHVLWALMIFQLWSARFRHRPATAPVP